MKNEKNIRYSVIIPSLNQSKILKQCLSHLSQLLFEPDLFEVLVIDNGSTDDTKEITLSFHNKINNLRYIYSDIPGLHTGRNLGFENAKGDILCFIDDDSFVTKGWLKGIEIAFQDPKVVLVGGPCLPKYEIEPPKWLYYLLGKSEFGTSFGDLSLLDFGDRLIPIQPGSVYGCNFNIRKSILMEFMGFPPDLFHPSLVKYSGNGESAISEKIKVSNLLTIYSPEVKIFHFVRKNRLTKEYLYKRSYEAGVRASYKTIREHYYNRDNTKTSKPIRGVCLFMQFSIKIIRFIFRLLRKFYHFIFLKEPQDVRKIRKIMQKGWKDGFAFHQNEVKKDSNLLEWVLRENYLGENGKLPAE